jgi:two-component system, cell cycle sensor histidine kinase and response regulator CckA
MRGEGAMKALLVGVSASSATVVANALGARGHERIVDDDGNRALHTLRRLSPALVVVEDPLADMSAAEFCRRARGCREGADAVILVITSREDGLPAVLDAGANDLYTTSLGPAALEIRVLIAERLALHHAQLRDREIRFRRLFESGITGVTIADLDGNFKEANSAFLQMLGYTHDDLIAGKLNWQVITPLDRVVPNIEARAQLRATGFLPVEEREYVHKDGRHIATLVGSAALEGTTECISYVTDISARKQAEETIRASEAKYRALFDESPFPTFLFDEETLGFLAVNDAAVLHYGYSRAEFLGMTLADIGAHGCVAGLSGLGTHGVGTAGPGVASHVRKDGHVMVVETSVHKLILDGKPSGFAVAVDVTERNRLEAQLRQAQKMEAIGNLAGGVAHDFNNLLSVILSYSEMLAATLQPGDPMGDDLAQISRAGRRAADLTRQLLAFSRQQMVQPRILDLNGIIDGIATLLRRVVGEDVELAVVVSEPGLATVSADAGQMEQVLMNLVVNARDAMPKGGKLTLGAANVEIDSGGAATHADVKPGAYVLLAVTDTGSGMDAATRERIFEPFFTTKPKGKGTGLGLSTVFGIVKQSGGTVVVDSEPGKGTTVRVYLPQAHGAALIPAVAAAETRTERGSETVLLVEDEELVRVVTRTILERHGYRVLEAHSGADAIRICEQYEATIHVLLTDVVMPGTSGTTLASTLGVLRPEMKVLYMSGHTDDAILRHGVLYSDVAFLEKPFTPETVTKKLREVLAAGGSRSRSSGDGLDAPRGQEGPFAADPEASSGTFSVAKARTIKANRTT